VPIVAVMAPPLHVMLAVKVGSLMA